MNILLAFAVYPIAFDSTSDCVELGAWDTFLDIRSFHKRHPSLRRILYVNMDWGSLLLYIALHCIFIFIVVFFASVVAYLHLRRPLCITILLINCIIEYL